MSKKYLYYFSEGNKAFGGDKTTMKNILGGKGAGLAEMTAAGMPVPQGFTITTEACTQYYADNREINDEIKADIFAEGDKVDVTAISKGKGFQGAIKRHGQHTGPKTHGSKYHRHAGSNGMASDPSKVMKGKKMPGQMGHVQITIQNLEVVKVDAENNLLLVKGAVPGPKKALVTIKETVKSGK